MIESNRKEYESLHPKSSLILLAGNKLTTKLICIRIQKLLYTMILYCPLFFLFLVRNMTAFYSILFGLRFFLGSSGVEDFTP